MTRPVSVRHAAVQVVHALETERGSLATLLPVWIERVDAKEQSLLQEICFGVARWSHRLGAVLEQLLKKPLRNKDRDVYALLKVGLYQLEYMRVPNHAALNKTVAVATEMRKPWAKGLVNGTLRNWLRESDSIEKKISQQSAISFPDWLLESLQNDWPDKWFEIAQQSNKKAPMTLRVNRRTATAGQYQEKLAECGHLSHLIDGVDSALVLEEPVHIEKLPGFSEGRVSVQDASAQRATQYLSPGKDERILDACAAPGGKTGHILEFEPTVKMTAVDISRERLDRVSQNVERLGFTDSVELVCSDAALLVEEWAGRQFDAIMLDAPCSGTGVIRRHPDIKLTRRETDIKELVETQRNLLFALWKLLKPKGRLLYATCSVLKAENDEQIQFFLEQTADASLVSIEAPDDAVDLKVGVQVLTGNSSGDGFFYSLLTKEPS